MTSLRLADYLEHMSRAASDACVFVEGFERADFLEDNRTQQAVTMSLIVLGEAATKVMDMYPEFIKANDQILWRSMRGMRNRIAHGYFEIDLDVVWETVQTALPKLLKDLPEVRAAALTYGS